MNVGQRILECRKAAGMTQGELAFITRISQSRISNIETGTNSNPTIKTLKLIADALDVRLAELFEMGD